MSADLPCPTIVTMPNHASTALTHPTEVRALTVAECAAVQEFPEEWKFVGTAQEQYRQVGNAVPVRLGMATGNAIAKCLDGGPLTTTPNAKSTPYRLVYLRSHVRTRRWFKEGKTKVWVDGADNDTAQYAPPVTHRREKVFVDA